MGSDLLKMEKYLEIFKVTFFKRFPNFYFQKAALCFPIIKYSLIVELITTKLIDSWMYVCVLIKNQE